MSGQTTGLPRHRRASAPTIYDIAAEAGVNPSTVSRALGKPGRVSEGTARKIREAAHRLDYRPNPMARALHTGRMNAMGLIVSDLTNPVFFEIVRGAQIAAAEGNYTLLLAESAEDPEQELMAAQRMAAGVDGLVLATSRLTDEQIRTLAGSRPIVVINREMPDVPCISAEVDTGVVEAVAHLHEVGHRHLAYLQGPGRSWISGRRGEAIALAAASRGLKVTTVASGEPTLPAGRASLARVVDTGATAVLAYNDLLAIGLLQQCQDEGIAVPDRLSIVGFDDIFGADLTSPRLSTIRSPLRECGEQALGVLAGALGDVLPVDGPGGVPGAGLSTQFILRGTTGSPMQ